MKIYSHWKYLVENRRYLLKKKNIEYKKFTTIHCLTDRVLKPPADRWQYQVYFNNCFILVFSLKLEVMVFYFDRVVYVTSDLENNKLWHGLVRVQQLNYISMTCVGRSDRVRRSDPWVIDWMRTPARQLVGNNYRKNR